MSKDVLTYRGYSARIEFDAEDGIFFGRIEGLTDVVGFHAEDEDNLPARFREAVDEYLSSR
jgi:predicted HicB family RNase H-like nuclease